LTADSFLMKHLINCVTESEHMCIELK